MWLGLESTYMTSRSPIKGIALALQCTYNSDDEDRFVLWGLSSSLRTLVVCHCYRESEEVIRIISARRANRMERAEYNRRWRNER
jgi:uncharacterized DUF497 family protein